MATSPTYATSNQYIKYRIVVTETATSIPNNTSTVNVKVDAWRTNSGYTTDAAGKCYCTINGTSYNSSWSYGQKPITHNSHTVLFEKNVTIPHNADGSKTIYVSSYIKHDKFTSSSHGFNVTLTNIPRKAEITAAPDFTDESNPTISYTNAAGATVDTLQACISLDNSTDTVAYRDIDKAGSSYTFNLSASDRSTLLAATPNSNTLTVYFIVKTVLGGTTYYSSVSKVMSVVNANPTLSGVTYKDTNGATTAITSDDQIIIQANSTLQFKFATLTAIKSATLANVKVKLDGTTYQLNLSGTTQSNKTINIGTVDSSSNLTAEVILTDSRGNTASTTQTVTMEAWSLPTAIISLQRVNNFYDETDLKVQSSYSSLDGQNVLTIQYQYKETSSGTYNSPVTISDNTTYQITLANTKEWDVRVILTDLIGSTTYNLRVGKGTPIFFADKLRSSVGINCLPQHDNAFEVNGIDATGLLTNAMMFTFLNTDTFVIEFPFEVDANNLGFGFIWTAGDSGEIDFSTTPSATFFKSHTASVTLAADNKTFTMQTNSALAGVTMILVGLYKT